MPLQNTLGGVVVGVDGSASSLAAVGWAAREAQMRGAPLTVVHVAVTSRFSASSLSRPVHHVPDELRDISEKEGRLIVDEALAVARAAASGDRQVEILDEVLFGAPVPTLVDLSKEAVMVVVGSHGCAVRHPRLLGSVSTGLTHYAHRPVALVPGGASSAPSADLPVLVGVDGSRASESAVAIAFDEASWRGVDLVALHAWSDSDIFNVDVLEESALRAAAEAMIAESLAGCAQRYPDVNVRRMVRFADPTRQLLEHARHSQLVVVGSHGRGGFAGILLGSVSAAVAQASHTPVIVARQP